jgi:prevent-host-death family protein
MTTPRRMSARDARANFSDLLGLVHFTKEPVIVEKKGRPYAVVISLEDFAKLEAEREKAFAVIDRVRNRNADKEPAGVLRDVTEEVEAVRQEQYEERAKATRGRR